MKRVLSSALLVVLCGVAGYFGSALGRSAPAGLEGEVELAQPTADERLQSSPLGVATGLARGASRRAPAREKPAALHAAEDAPGDDAPARAVPRSADEQLVAEIQADERDAERGEQHRKLLEGAFQAESVDQGWARAAEVDLSNALSQARFEHSLTKVSTIECRSTMCKVVVVHSSTEAQGEFAGSEGYLDLTEPFPEAFFKRERGGAGVPASTVVFLGRDETGLFSQLDTTNQER